MADAALTQALACVRVGTADFDLSTEVAALREGDLGVGAVVTFVGTVREWALPDLSGGSDRADRSHIIQLTAAPVMTLEHYPGMTERSIAEIIVAARARFGGVRGVRVIHRVGALALAEQIVLVAVCAAHRGEAFACCEFLMDWLKTRAPFWKKEESAEGGRWVDARQRDDQAAARWGIAPGCVATGPAAEGT